MENKKEKFTPSFTTLNTKGGAVADFRPEDRPVVAEVEEYLAHVAGARNGKTLCPFTRGIFVTNGFRLALIKESPDSLDLSAVAIELGRELGRLSPGRVGRGIPTELKAVVAAFAHPECRDESFGHKLQETHTRLRQSFLERGHMFSAMFETHPDPAGNRGFRSSVPLFVARRMHERDGVFMRTPEAETAFRIFFPESK